MIYILKKNSKNRITSLKSQNALMELIKNSYAINLFDEDKRYLKLNSMCRTVKKSTSKMFKKHSDH